MTNDLLQRIQTLQFDDKYQAEMLLRDFIRDTFGLDVASLELRPLAVSLNSFNGFLTLSDGKKLFFKTHTEPDNVIGEYYNATMLAQAGYPVIQPIYSSTEASKQFLIYEVIESPSVFDVAWEIETGTSQALPQLTQAQQDADNRLLGIYRHTLEWQSAATAAQAPVHQLFYHRLAGGRLERFYGALPGHGAENVQIVLPDGNHSMAVIRQLHWVINGQIYKETLDDLISSSLRLLNPAQGDASIIGHGDAHNGNVFFREHETSLLYFDPAFAGRHHPLLDLTKPLFHNVFAMWMYFPQIKGDALKIEMQYKANTLHITHDYTLSAVREMFLHSKAERVLLPILGKLQRQGWLRSDWRAYLKAALFCCPFLTMNLADSAKFPPEISLLGLAMAMEMGAESHQHRSRIDRTLDEVTAHLS